MIFNNFEINALPKITDVLCPVHHNDMIEIPENWGLTPKWYCPKCKRVYQLKIVKVPEKQIDKKELIEFLKKIPPAGELHAGGIIVSGMTCAALALQLVGVRKPT